MAINYKEEIKLLQKRLSELQTAQPSDETMELQRDILDRIDELRSNELPKPLTMESGPLGSARNIDPKTDLTGSAKDKTFRGMFYGGQKKSLDMGGFKNASEFLEVISSGRFDSRLVRASMVEGQPSAGGFSVPDEFAAQWLDTALEEEIIRPRAVVWPMKSPTRKVPGWDANDHTDGSLFGGFTIQWLVEEGTGTKQTGKLRLVELNAKKGAIYCDVSNELVSDGLGFEAQLEEALKKSLAYGLDYNFLNGQGASGPLGIRNDPALISVSKETGQGSATILYENLTKMWARMYGPCRKRAVWICNADCIPQLMTVSISIGTAGSAVPIFSEKDGQYRIFGRPVLFSEHMPTVGSENDILLVDLSQYAVGLRKEISLDKSNIPGWTQDLMSYRVLVRVDGQGTWNTYITPRNGSTQSWCVSLAERA